MLEKLKIGLRIIIALPVLVLIAAIVIAVGLPALVGYLISMGAIILSKNTFEKLSPALKENYFIQVLHLLIMSAIISVAYLFYIPLAIAAIPLMIYLEISEYLAGRWLEKHVFAHPI